MVVRIAKRCVAAVFLVLTVGAFCGGHKLCQAAVSLQAVPAMLKHPLVAVPLFLALTALFGRFFCEMMCPLGILQSLVNWLTHPRRGVRRVCTRLPETTAQRVVRWSVVAVVAVLLALGLGAFAYAVEPYSILGRTLTLLMPFPILFGVILVVAAVGDGRFWCNWICPVGTIFTLVSRVAPFGNRVCKGCANCRKCFPKPAATATDAAPKADEAAGGVTRRDAVKGLAAVAAVEKTTDGGLADLVCPGRATDRAASVLPPGAVSRARFTRTCVACGLCITACPTKVLVPSRRLRTFGQPELDFADRVCNLACDQQCAKACPAGALQVLRAPRKDIHIGRAVWRSDRCVRTTSGDPCTLCSRRCPLHAIHLVGGAVVVDDRLCVGCGICEAGCAARPEPAIVVEGLDCQRVVLPMDEGDLLAEMKTLLDGGDAVVVARDGVIRACEQGRGIAPLMRLFKADALQQAVVVDRVIGRAAAAICIAGGARRVHAKLMSAGAADLLRAYKVECTADETVPQILNRDQTGSCPMEAAVKDLSDPSEMVKALQKKLEHLLGRSG